MVRPPKKLEPQLLVQHEEELPSTLGCLTFVVRRDRHNDLTVFRIELAPTSRGWTKEQRKLLNANGRQQRRMLVKEVHLRWLKIKQLDTIARDLDQLLSRFDWCGISQGNLPHLALVEQAKYQLARYVRGGGDAVILEYLRRVGTRPIHEVWFGECGAQEAADRIGTLAARRNLPLSVCPFSPSQLLGMLDGRTVATCDTVVVDGSQTGEHKALVKLDSRWRELASLSNDVIVWLPQSIFAVVGSTNRVEQSGMALLIVGSLP